MKENISNNYYNYFKQRAEVLSIKNKQKKGNSLFNGAKTRYQVNDDISFRCSSKNKFDVRSYYKTIKQSHPLHSIVYQKQENEIRKTYIQNEGLKIVHSYCATPKSNTPKKYAKQKLTKFKKGIQFNFNELFQRIKTIGQ